MPHHQPDRELLSRRAAIKLAAAAAVMGPRAASASEYPGGPITMIVPLPAGTVLDLIGRFASMRFQKDLGQPIIVENVAGAAGNLGVARAARAKPDGQTILYSVSGPVSTNKFVMKNMPYDVDKNLAPVILVGSSPVAIVVHKSFPVSTLPEFIAYAKAHPGEISYGSSGVGSPQHLCAEYLQTLADIKLLHVPYKGAPESANDVIAGHIPCAFTSVSLTYEQSKAGEIRILAICDDERTPIAPELPTIRETVPQFLNAPTGWQAMFVPAGTPPEVIAILNREMNLVFKDPDLISRFKGQFTSFIGGEPDAVTKKIKSEGDVITSIVKRIGLEPQ
jgi:tripartite-type tricarboxylate transporter receptor subunit TctC